MIALGCLRVVTPDGLPFAREKLRSMLVLAGLRRVQAAQIAAQASQRLRAAIPAEVRVYLDASQNTLHFSPAELVGKLEVLQLPGPVRRPEDLVATLARLTRDELLNDLERQVEERTRDLEAERERSERLLKNMLPDAIAQRMKAGETTIADAHVATVLFADLKGFTVMSSTRTPQEVVELLDAIFKSFDELASKYGLEKIKTIGDAYMAAAGLPLPQPDHAERAARMALELAPALQKIRQSTGVEVDVRVGLHCGEVVAGVIGTSKYAYDLWGDTVNVASRMESHGAPGRVHISEAFRAALPATFGVEARERIEVKGKGEMQTFWLLSADE